MIPKKIITFDFDDTLTLPHYDEELCGNNLI